jgi:hypothetical protein
MGHVDFEFPEHVREGRTTVTDWEEREGDEVSAGHAASGAFLSAYVRPAGR